MATIKNAGIKGYVVMAGLIGLLLFVILVVYIYKLNQAFVPDDPEYWGSLLQSAASSGWA